MFRMIRTSTLRALREDVAEADRAAQTYSDEAEKWYQQYTEESGRADAAEAAAESLRHEAELATDSAIRAETTAETLLRALGQANAEIEKWRQQSDAGRGCRDVAAPSE